MSTTQPEALRLADWLEDQVVIYQQFSEGEPGGYAQEVDQVMDEAAAELRRQHADLAHAARYAEQLGRELAKAGAEIADLRARVQELGQMARDVNSRRVVELEAQLASIGAGGVSLTGAANAGSEPVAWQYRAKGESAWFDCSKERVLVRASHPDKWELRALYTHPSPPEGMAGWRRLPVEATEEMKAAAVKYANGSAVYKNVKAEVLRIEEGIYGEVYEAMVAAAPSLPTPRI